MEEVPLNGYDITLRFILISVCIQCVNFNLSFWLSIDNFTGTTNFLTVTILSIKWGNKCTSLVQIIPIILMFVWSLRLGGFLLYRMYKRGGLDSRMNKMRKKWYQLLLFWVIHCSWCNIVSIPVTILNLLEINSNQCNNMKLNYMPDMLDYIGLIIWLYGFIVESVSDQQKLNYWLDKRDNKLLFCNVGLWKYSRNPNFAGEIILWFGLSIFTINNIIKYYDVSNPLIIVAPLVSPIFTGYVLLRLSGVNFHEWKDQKICGNDPKYIEYRNNTSPVWPCPSILYKIMPHFVKQTLMCEWKYYIRRSSKKKKM